MNLPVHDALYAWAQSQVAEGLSKTNRMAADDVAKAVGRIAVGAPANGIVEIAGPEQSHLDTFIRHVLDARDDPREVLSDPEARYFGAVLGERTLVPGPGAILGETRFDDWLNSSTTATHAVG